MSVDEWGMITLREKVEELGYDPLQTKLLSNGIGGLFELHSDSEIWPLVNSLCVGKPKELEICVVKSEFTEASNIGSDIEEHDVESNTDGSDEDYEDEVLEEFYDSDYDFVEGKKDDREFDKYVDVTVEYGGVQTSPVAEHGVEGANEVNDGVEGAIVVADGLDLSDENVVSDGDNDEHKWPIFRAKTDMENPIFCIGLTFASREEFKEAIQNYGIKNGKHLKFEKIDKLRVTVSCKQEGCPWRINCRKLKNTFTWRVLSYNEKHEGCGWVYENNMITATKAAKRWKNEIRHNSDWNIVEFQNKVKADDKFSLTIRQCYKAMTLARGDIKGEQEEQFKKLWSYYHEIQKTNPMSNCIVKPSEYEEPGGKKRFLRFYMCWEACMEGHKYCRPIIGFDGCHLKAKTGGQILTAVGIDPNDSIFPLAYAIVEGENKESWTWFLKLLKKDLDLVNHSNLTLISDKQKGLIPAFEEVFPEAIHRFCVRHLYGNLRVAGFHGKAIKDALWTAARATTVNSFTRAMRNIHQLDVDAFQWLSDKHPSEWSRSHFTTSAQCDVLVNNICECFNAMILNARKLPLIPCLEALRNHLMPRFFNNRKKAANEWKSTICPRIMEKIAVNEEAAASYLCTQCDEDLFEVRGMWEDGQQVDLRKRSCSCRRWELTGIPCKHAIRAIWLKKLQVINFVSPMYSTECYLKAYAGSINPMAGPDEWPITDREPLLPPLYTSCKAGRPRKLRKKSAGEVSKTPRNLTTVQRSKIKLHCTKCKQPGHNARRCPTDPAIKERLLNPKKRIRTKKIPQPVREATNELVVEAVREEVNEPVRAVVFEPVVEAANEPVIEASQ
ncbi:PREDICTED: uncharacterized protein LOC109190352 [Ipomoea nil]|uniref:uncharacterized protein LOC109190352 n=1 Tax=Ipomoea nil TaxID=35883 RepID=UPI0009011029|nr:PREDICTED: uncharacterized protein LOC109190352 [Ipomoea nil]